jgi:hypothetical protein
LIIKNQVEATKKIQLLLQMHGTETTVTKVKKKNNNQYHFELIEHEGYQAHHVKFSKLPFKKLAKFYPNVTSEGDSINAEYLFGLISTDWIYFAQPSIIYRVKVIEVKQEALTRLTSQEETTYSFPFNKMKVFWKDEVN